MTMLLSITFQEFAVQEYEYDGERGGGDDAGLGGRKIRDKGEFCSWLYLAYFCKLLLLIVSKQCLTTSAFNLLRRKWSDGKYKSKGFRGQSAIYVAAPHSIAQCKPEMQFRDTAGRMYNMLFPFSPAGRAACHQTRVHSVTQQWPLSQTPPRCC